MAVGSSFMIETSGCDSPRTNQGPSRRTPAFWCSSDWQFISTGKMTVCNWPDEASKATVFPHIETLWRILFTYVLLLLTEGEDGASWAGQRVEATIIPYLKKLEEASPTKSLIETLEVHDGGRGFRRPTNGPSTGSRRWGSNFIDGF